MGWLVELLVSAFARPVLGAVLALFGYDLDWDRKGGQQVKGWRFVLACLFCCAVCAMVLGGLIWLVWFFSR
jgi:hypothetical protein